MTQAARAHAENLWQVSRHSAKLALPGLEGNLELEDPHKGLFHLSVFGREPGGQILGVQYAPDGAELWAPLAECYERGTDLIAAYEQTDRRPFRATVYWRAEHEALPQAPQGSVRVDLIVSVQTSLLDVTPELRTRSQVSGAETHVYPTFAASPSLDIRGAQSLQDQSRAASPGCVVACLKDIDATYCEMIHPSDRRGLEATQRDAQSQWGWPLVGHFMEKGVIRRLRIRGIFLPGQVRESLIADLYAEFAASPPPLTT